MKYLFFYLKKLLVRIYILLFVLCFHNRYVIGQTQSNENPHNLPVFSKPAVSSLFKYVEYPVGNFTGVPDIKVPIFEFQFNGINFPISLSYHGSGIKVNDVSSWVGLGWSLQAGGSITRNVMGIADENPARGIINIPVKKDDEIAKLSSNDAYRYLEDIVLNKIDSEPDAFYYNFLGTSGKFSLSAGDKIFQQPFTDNNIEFTKGDFKITDSYGRQFFFTNKEDSFIYNNGGGPFYKSTTTWNLTKIISNDKRDTVRLEYIKADFSDIIRTVGFSMQVGSLKQLIINNTGNPDDSGEENFPIPSSSFESKNYCYLSKITFPSGSIKFISSSDRKDYGMRKLDSIIVSNRKEVIKRISLKNDYFISEAVENLYTIPQDKFRLKLVGLNNYDIKSSKEPENYQFYYNEKVKIPPRNTFGIDWWGYYNGENSNKSLIPFPPYGKEYEFNSPDGRKAVTNASKEFGNRDPNEKFMDVNSLTKITYPSGGHVDFEFEPNRRSRTKDQEKTITLAYVIGTKENSGPTKSEFVADRTIKATLSMNIPLWNDKSQPFIEIRNLTNPGSDFYRFTAYPGEATFRTAEINLREGNKYQVVSNIFSNPRDPDDDYDKRVIANIYYKTFVPEVISEIGPGLRIKIISSFDSLNSPATITEYKYGKNENGFGQARFFDYIFDWRSYVQNFHFSYSNPYIADYAGQALIVLANPIFDYSSEGNLLCYPFVTKYSNNIQKKEFIKTEYEYSFELDQQFGHGFPEPSSLVSTFWKNGLLLKETKFDSNPIGGFDTIQMIENSYSDIEKTINYGLKVRQYIIPKGENIRHGNSEYFFRYFNYPIISGRRKLTTTKQTIFERNKNRAIQSTFYNYIDPFNILPRIIVKEVSDGSKLITYQTFPIDYLEGSQFIDSMKNGNLLDFPIEKIIFNEKNNKKRVSSGELHIYDLNGKGLIDKYYQYPINLIQPQIEIKVSNRINGGSLESGSNSTFSSDSKYFLTHAVLLRDKYQNPLEVLSKSTPVDVYIWGYSGQYPIAKIVNSKYQDVIELLGGGKSTSNILAGKAILDRLNLATVSDDYIREQIDKLRKGLPSSQVSTYTYSPLVGMTSMTDPRGITEYYQYDGFQRLKQLLDFDLNVLKDYQYHYRTN